MATYVLVGGAFIGGWAWKTVARQLREHGHDVYPVTLTGLGERVHLAHAGIDLETHIADVVNVIRYEDLANVVLVGHSYAGIVVTGVADRAGDRLSQLVFVDSAPLNDGDRILDLNPPGEQEALLRQVAELGDGWRLPPPDFAHLPMTPSLAGFGDDERALLAAKSVAQPFRTYAQPLRLSGSGAGDFGRVVIVCNDFRDLLASGNPAVQFLSGPEWRRYDLATGHWPMLSAPGELAELLHGLVAG